MKSTATNMTEGSILRNLIYFAIPVLIGNIFQQLYNVADTAIIGNILGDNALAAVGTSAPVYGLLIGFAGGLTNGFAVIIARYFGAGNEREMKKSVALTYILSAVIALVLTVSSVIALHPLMKALKTPDEIIADTESYMRVIILFSALTIAYNMLAGMMRAIGNSKAPLYFLIVSTFVNIGLDFLFVKGFDMGVAGAAFATVISQGVSVVLCFIYAAKKCDFLIFRKSELVFDKALLGDLTSTGLSMGLMYAIVSVGSVILQGAVNGFGTATITAHTAARKIDDIFMLPLGTIALASSTFASQNYGAGKTDRVKQGIKCSIIIAEIWSAFSVAVAVIFRRPLVQALTGTTDEAVIATASKYIVINISFFFVLGVLLVLRSSLQGVGRKLVPVSGSIVEFLLKIVAVSVLAPQLGYLGICICEPMIWAACAGIVLADYSVFMRKTNVCRLDMLWYDKDTEGNTMTELEKLEAGLEYCYDDEEVSARKEKAIIECRKYNAIDDTDYEAQYAQLKAMLGSVGKKVWIAKTFNCDNGKKIFIGNNFTGNYNLTILDIREVYIGDNVMIGPNTLITTVGHPLSPMGRRKHLGIAKPVRIGNDVWIGGNVTILPGVTIGNNVVVAAGAVVTKDIPDNCVAGGVPARKIKDIENDTEGYSC